MLLSVVTFPRHSIGLGFVCLWSIFMSVTALKGNDNGLPVIVTQPQPQTTFAGANVNLRVAVSGSGLRYVWRLYGTNLSKEIPGQFTSLLSLRGVTRAASGPYSVIVSNSFGAVTSETAVVTVNLENGGPIGYINISAKPGYSMLAFQLAQFGTNQTIAGQIPDTRDGASIFSMDGSGFVANNYLDGWSEPGQILVPGQAWFFHNPGSDLFTVTVVGNVVLGRLVNRLPGGYSACADIVPQGAPLTVLGFPSALGSKVFRYDNASDTYSIFEVTTNGWEPEEPSTEVARSFWAYEPGPVDWIQNFSAELGWSFGTYMVVQPEIASTVGEVNFFTHNSDGISGRVFDLDGTTGLNSKFRGQLYAGTNEEENALLPVGLPASFLEGAGAGYIRAGSVKLPGVAGGQTVYLQLRVWEECAGDTYEQAVSNGSAAGRSTVFSLVAHACLESDGPGLPPRNANLFPNFSIRLGEASPLRVARVRKTPAGAEICFATQPGWVYRLEKVFSCAQASEWNYVPGADRIVGTGHVATVLDTVGEQCFYRLFRVE